MAENQLAGCFYLLATIRSERENRWLMGTFSLFSNLQREKYIDWFWCLMTEELQLSWLALNQLTWLDRKRHSQYPAFHPGSLKCLFVRGLNAITYTKEKQKSCPAHIPFCFHWRYHCHRFCMLLGVLLGPNAMKINLFHDKQQLRHCCYDTGRCIWVFHGLGQHSFPLSLASLLAIFCCLSLDIHPLLA